MLDQVPLFRHELGESRQAGLRDIADAERLARAVPGRSTWPGRWFNRPPEAIDLREHAGPLSLPTPCPMESTTG